MDSESAAQASAQQKHHKHMMFGKKQRYIEVFQCSGEDMNMVLSGGYQYTSPPTIPAKPIAPSGMLPTRPHQQAQPLQISIPPPLTLSLTQSSVLQNSTNSNATVVGSVGANQAPAPSLLAQQQQAHFIAHQSLMVRQQAAAAAQHQSDQISFFQNFNFLQSGATQGMPTHPFSYAMSPQMSQFYFLPRHSMLPMGLLSNPVGQIPGPYPGMSSGSGYAHSSIQAGQIPVTPNSVPQQHPHLATSNAKRSYENAFCNDQINVSSAKRIFQPGNIYGNFPYRQL